MEDLDQSVNAGSLSDHASNHRDFMIGELSGVQFIMNRFDEFFKAGKSEEDFIRGLHYRMKRHIKKRPLYNLKFYDGKGHGYMVVLSIFENHRSSYKPTVKKFG